MEKLFNLKQNSRALYMALRSSSPYYCNAIKGFVFITNNGWNHIIGQEGHRKRSTSDVFRRLSLLPLVKKVIDNAKGCLEERVENNVTYLSIESSEMLEINNEKKKKKIVVVLLKDKYGKCSFLSIMDKDMDKKKS